jgi:hypothetical protein
MRCLVSNFAHFASTRAPGPACDFGHVPLEVTMERFIHEQNLASYRRLIAESELGPERNQIQHKWLLKVLADEIANGVTLLGPRH